MARFATGLVIGKFYPPHRGHKLLIDTALAQCEQVIVLLTWRHGESPPGDARLAFLREIHPRAEIVSVEDPGHEDDSRAWAEYTLALLAGRRLDAVFTSEDYGDPYARWLGVTHVLVDRERRRVPCSGTRVRARPLDCFEHLEPCVRAWYAKRVCVVGAESTGTTTLARALAEHYRTAWVAEYGREYTERRPAGAPWTSDEFLHIAEEQARREDRAAREANRLLLCDTDPFATAIWHRRYVGARSPEVEAFAARRRYDLYLLTGDEIPFEQDGTRDGEHVRHWMHELFVHDLTATGRPWVLVRGSHEERLRVAVERVERVLAAG